LSEWLGIGLQNRLRRFESATDLWKSLIIRSFRFYGGIFGGRMETFCEPNRPGITNKTLKALINWKIRSHRAPNSGSTEQTIPKMIEHHNPEYKQHNISAKLFYNLFIYGLLTLNRNSVLPNAGFSKMKFIHFPASAARASVWTIRAAAAAASTNLV
jgi:hypothetical protein